MRIVVLGYIVRGPMGGMAWHHLQYVLGFHRLGHDVWFLEDSGDYPECYDPRTYLTGSDASYGLAFAADAFARLGLEGRWAYFDAPAGDWRGPAASGAREVCETADVLINVSGVNPIRSWMEPIPIRAFVDTDPLFVQARHAARPEARALALAHNRFFSFGENVEAVREVVDDGFDWRPTRQPVVVDCWAASPPPAGGRFTTVMQWDSYAGTEIGGRSYGMKSRSFPPYLDLPSRATGAVFELAMAEPPPSLTEAGWRTRDPREVAATPWSYSDFIAGSLAEFSVAKEGYVASASGWFSERSANYLASGRPVVAQDTGFRAHLPVGAGLHAFSCPDEALAGVEAILADPVGQARAAREIADSHFAAEGVLTRLIAEC